MELIDWKNIENACENTIRTIQIQMEVESIMLTIAKEKIKGLGGKTSEEERLSTGRQSHDGNYPPFSPIGGTTGRQSHDGMIVAAAQGPIYIATAQPQHIHWLGRHNTGWLRQPGCWLPRSRAMREL